jgi:hypothetical protein
MSSGLPTRPFGFALSSASSPPLRSINTAAILLMKNPGAIALTRIWRGPSSIARLRARCMTAALLAAYEYAPLSPREPVPMPATLPVTMTREESCTEALAARRGANLQCVSKHTTPQHAPASRAQRSNALLYREKHGLDIQIHHLVPRIPLIHVLKPTPPTRARIRKQNIHVIRVRRHLADQPLNLSHLRTVRGHAVCARARREVRQRVERRGRRGAGGGFARRDEDFGTPRLQQPGRRVQTQAPRAAGDDGNFAGEREEGGEVGELNVGFGGHGGWFGGGWGESGDGVGRAVWRLGVVFVGMRCECLFDCEYREKQAGRGVVLLSVATSAVCGEVVRRVGGRGMTYVLDSGFPGYIARYTAPPNDQ